MQRADRHDALSPGSRPTAAALALAASLVLGGCAQGLPARFDASDEERRARSSIKGALIASPLVDAAPVDVRVERGRVVLDGFAESAAASAEAERIARALYPEREIVNRLEVR